MSRHSDLPTNKRRRFTPVVLIAGVASAIVLSLSMSGTLSAFTASIANTVNSAGTGTIVMQESDGTNVCNSSDATPAANNINTNAATCATINKYGGVTTMVPTNAAGTSNLVTTNITIKNTGTAAVSTFTLTPGTCGQVFQTVHGSATDFCSKLNISIKSGATTVYSGTAAGLTAAITLPTALIPVAGGAATPFTFTTSVDTSAGNTYQGITATQTLTWAFSS